MSINVHFIRGVCFLKKIIITIFIFMLFMPIVKAEDSLNLDSESAILIDEVSGKVLYEKNPDAKLPMASMTKIMSMLLMMTK